MPSSHAHSLETVKSSRASILQFMRFAVVGAAGTAVHYAALITLVTLSLSGPAIASAMGACLGAGVNYWLNYRFTFASTRPHRQMAPRFFAAAMAGAFVNGAIVSQLCGFGMHFLIAQLIATCVVLVSNFLISKKWIFRKSK